MRDTSIHHCLRVLVVDDCKDTRESLGLLLQTWGHEVKLARDGCAALETFEAFCPEAVLLDIGLPGMDGWEVARRMRQLQGDTEPLLVAMTGCGRAQDQARSREAGFDAHLTKPARLADLRALLAKAAEAYDLIDAA